MTKINKGMTATFVALALAGTAFTAAPAFAAGKMTISSPQDPGSWDPIDTFLVQWAVSSHQHLRWPDLSRSGPETRARPCRILGRAG